MPTIIEIERKFLIHKVPCDLSRMTVHKIKQGYLFVSTAEEVRLRRANNVCTLAVKTGAGLRRRETEVVLSKKQYKALWPLTKGKRVYKNRYLISRDRHTIVLDVYKKRLKGLITAEVEFSTTEQSAAFSPPAWFLHEVTDNGAFKNKHLALHGLAGYPRQEEGPEKKDDNALPDWIYNQSGVLAYRTTGSQLEILLITTLNSRKWSIPKGIVEPHLSPTASARKEALEEGGVEGSISAKSIGSYTVEKWGGSCTVKVFPLKVTKVHDTWQEMQCRDRRWFPVEQAAKCVHHAGLAHIIDRFGEEKK